MRFFIALLALFLLSTPLVFPHTPLPAVSESHEMIVPQTEEVLVAGDEPQEETVTEKEKPLAPAQPESAPLPTPTKTEVASPRTQDLAALLEETIWTFTNNERMRRGLEALTKDTLLAETARSHSADMLERDFFEHENPDGCSSSCRATNAGYEWRMIGENIYMLEGFEFSPDETAAMIVSGWMESPGHRANILREGYTDTGVGVVVHGSAIYATVLYATPR